MVTAPRENLLAWVLRNRQWDFVRLLVHYGANPHRPLQLHGKRGEPLQLSAADFAAHMGMTAIAEYISGRMWSHFYERWLAIRSQTWLYQSSELFALIYCKFSLLPKFGNTCKFEQPPSNRIHFWFESVYRLSGSRSARLASGRRRITVCFHLEYRYEKIEGSKQYTILYTRNNNISSIIIHLHYWYS